MSHREGTPQNQNNGPLQNPVPHSGRHHGEKNVHDFRNPNGSIMSIEDAVKEGKFKRPDGSPYTVEEIMNMLGSDEPIGLAPGSIADHADPSAGPKTEAYTPMIETSKKKKRRLTALLATGAVLLGGGGAYAAAKAFSGNDGQANPQPIATGPAVAGSTTVPQANSTPSEATSTDIQSSLANGEKTKDQTELAKREPFYNQGEYLPASAFTTLLTSDATYDQLRKLDPKAFVADRKGNPGFNIIPDKETLSAENLFASKATLDKLFESGLMDRAIAESNKTQGTHLGRDSFIITADEIPATGASKAEIQKFLKDVVLTPDEYQAAAVALERSAGGFKIDTPLASKDIIEAPRLAPTEKGFDSDNTKIVVGYSQTGPEDYLVGAVPNPGSLLLTNNVDTRYAGQGQAGYAVENGDVLGNNKSTIVPVFGVLAEVNELEHLDTGTISSTTHNVVRWFTTIPASEKAAGGKKDASYVVLIAETEANIK